MIRGNFSPRWSLLLSASAVLVLLAVYAWLTHRQHALNPADTTIPTFSQLWDGVKQMTLPHPRTGERWLFEDSLATLYRLFCGLFWGILGGFAVGLMMGCFGVVEAVLGPPIKLFAKVPPTAALAVFFVLTNTDHQMYIAMIAFGVLPVLAQSVYLAVCEVPQELIDKSYTIGASHAEVVWCVLVRHILPKLLDAIRLQIGPAMVYLIAAEMVFGDVGFGYRIRLQQKLLNMSVVYPYLVLLACFGFFMDYILSLAQRTLCPWYARGSKE